MIGILIEARICCSKVMIGKNQNLETVYIIKYLGSTREMTSAAFESCDLFHSVQAMKRADGEKKVN